MNIVSTYPSWYILLCIILGLVLSFLLYRKDKKLVEFSQWVIYLLFAFRTLSISIIAVLLLGPLVKYFDKTVEKPLIIVAQDNSESMLLSKDSSFIKNELQEKITSLQAALDQDFETVQFQFGNEVKKANKTFDYDDKLSDYDLLFDELENKFANRNVGGLIVVSDGIYNHGGNPTYRADQIEYPIFPIATGDTSIYTDVRINNLRNNKIAFLGNEFPIEFDVIAKKAKNKTVLLTIRNGDRLLHSEQLTFSKRDQYIHISTLIKAEKIGKQKFSISVSPLEEESNTLNNHIDFYTDVLDGRQKIALLSVHPHPDISAINRALSANENYELVLSSLDEFDRNFTEFDLVILHQSIVSNDIQLNAKLQELIKTNLPILLIGGGWQNVEIQFDIRTNKTTNRRNIKNESLARVNEVFSLFNLNDRLIDKIEGYPPLTVSANQPIGSNGNTILLYQKIGSVSTNYPLLSFYEKDGRKIGRLAGEGIWKWSIMNYATDKNHELFDSFISKMVQFLAIKADRSFFRLNAADEYFENERISFDAQLFNPSYELINEEEVTLKLVNEEGKEYSFVMNPSGSSYNLSIPALPPANYEYTALVNFQGKTLTEKGNLTIKQLRIEQMQLEADHQLLSQLAQRSEGQMIYPSEIEKLVRVLKEREDIVSISYMNEEVEEIINLKWIFYLILALLGIEWFVRKRGGAY